VRNCYDNYKKEVQKGIVPENCFNLSYASQYVTYKSFKENIAMFYLKLKKYRRTEISRYIFSLEMVENILKVYDMMFGIFGTFFRANQQPTSKLIMVVALETLMLLFLETKDHRFDELI
jgi:hypothetical protein